MIIGNIFYKQNAEKEEYLDIVIAIDDVLYDIYCGNLKPITGPIDIGKYKRVEEVDALKKKYGGLTIKEHRYTNDCDYYLLLNDDILFVSEHQLNSNSELSFQIIYFIEEVRRIKNKDIYEKYLSAQQSVTGLQ